MFGRLFPIATAALLCTHLAPAFATTGTQEHVVAATKIAKQLLASRKRMIGEFSGTHAYRGLVQRNSLWVVQKLGSSSVHSRFDLHPPGDPKNPDGVLRHAETRIDEEPAQKAATSTTAAAPSAAPTTPAPATAVRNNAWAKQQALKRLAGGDSKGAVWSLVEELMKNPQNKQRELWLVVGARAAEGSVEAARKFIEGFND
jgi:hypothetical protein